MTSKQAPSNEKQQAIDIDESQRSERLPATITDAQPPAIPDDEQWASIESGDYAPPDSRGSIPYYHLDRRVGEGFTDDETGEKGLQELSFVWLAKSATRAWFEQEYGKGEKFPTCRSADALTPDANSPAVQSAACAVCPHMWRNWRSDAGDRKCGESVEALVFIPSNGEVSIGHLAILRFGGLAWKPAIDYWGSFDLNLPKRPPLSAVTRCTLEVTVVERFNSKVLVPRFERVALLNLEQAKVMMTLRDAHKAEFLGRVAEDVATRSADADEANGKEFTEEKWDGERIEVEGGEAF